jgi:hypothetical protein
MSSQGTTKLKSATPNLPNKNAASISALLQQYGCGPIPFVGTENAFYERHGV